MLNTDAYHLPKTLAEALVLWRDASHGSRLVAGTTDLLPWAREGRAGDVHLPAIIDLSRVAELAGHHVAGDTVRLGANTVFQAFLTDGELMRHMPCMPGCAVWFADDQIREQATLVGNVCNASPAADGTPALLAMDATLEIARLDGDRIATRTITVDDFVEGPARTGLAADEIVTAVTCPSFAGYGGSFQKVGQRRSLVISAVCAAALVKADGDTFADVRLALGGIGSKPVRLHDIEDMLRGQTITKDLVVKASAIPAGRVASRTRQDYRRAVVRGFVQAAIEDALTALGAPKHGDTPREAAHA